MTPTDQDQEDYEDMVAALVNKELLNALFAQSVPLLKLVISKGLIPVHVCDCHKQRGSGTGCG
jgi:hypothetical protein